MSQSRDRDGYVQLMQTLTVSAAAAGAVLGAMAAFQVGWHYRCCCLYR